MGVTPWRFKSSPRHQTTNHSSLSPSRRGIEPRVLRIADVEARLRVSKRTIYYWIANGRFPRSDVELGSQLRAWRTETVAAWLESRTVDPA